MTKRPSAADVVARLGGGVVTSDTKAPPKPKAKAKAKPKPKVNPSVGVPPMPAAVLSLEAALVTCAKVVVAPDLAASVVERAVASGETLTFESLACPEARLGGDAMLVHPAFVRAAARRGYAFYAGPSGRVRRFSLASTSRRAPAGVTPYTEGEEFYLKPAWYDDLAGFLDRGEPVLLIGPAGAGKSESVERVFADRKQQLRIVPCHQRMTANDLEGAVDLVIEDGHQVTRFTPADPAIASKEGHGLLLDEADAAPAEAMYAVYRLIDGKPMHILRKGTDAIVERHEAFRVVGTQNTEGRGDDRGLHHGRSYQDEAFLDRWQNTIRVDYPRKADEVLILRKRTGISGVQAERIVDAAIAFRNALRHDEIMMVCSLRRTLAVAANIAAGKSPERSWGFAVLNRATREDADNLPQVLQRIYGDKWRKAP